MFKTLATLGMDIIKIIESSLFGNSIGLISFIMGIISFVITCFTYRKTRLVKEEVEKIVQTASSRTRLSVYRKSFLEILQTKFDLIEKQGYISSTDIFALSKVSLQILDCSDGLKEKNRQIVRDAYEFIFHYTSYKDEMQLRKLGNYITRIINILENGDEVL